MKSRYIENGLAMIGALIILIGVSTAASSAFAAAPLETLDIEAIDRISITSVGAE